MKHLAGLCVGGRFCRLVHELLDNCRLRLDRLQKLDLAILDLEDRTHLFGVVLQRYAVPLGRAVGGYQD
jgi:hypothetical protein